jgi:hypothetical protein
LAEDDALDMNGAIPMRGKQSSVGYATPIRRLVMHDVTKKRVLALVAAGAMVLAGTSVSTARDSTKKSNMNRSHHAMQVQRDGWNRGWRAQTNPLTWPFAAVEGAGLAAGAIVGGTAAAVGGTAAALTGQPYYGHAYYP